jgi:hypothetical protein
MTHTLLLIVLQALAQTIVQAIAQTIVQTLAQTFVQVQTQALVTIMHLLASLMHLATFTLKVGLMIMQFRIGLGLGTLLHHLLVGRC